VQLFRQLLLEEVRSGLAYAVVVRYGEFPRGDEGMSELVAFLIGAAAGYLGVRLGDLGEAAVGLFLAALIGSYLWRSRISSAAALSIGAGAVVVVLLGGIVLDTARDPAVHLEAPTYVGLMVGLLLAAFGLALGVSAFIQRRKSAN
jgi:hypothetical protein